VVIGTASNTYTAPGITSAASRRFLGLKALHIS
jgi:hypothetical protein